MLTIGLTGGIGSGKTTVSDLFAEHGVPVIDTDEIARKLTGPGQPAVRLLAERFGQNIARRDGSLDRDAMRKIAFSNQEARQDLQNILHPLIRQEVQRRLASCAGPYAVIVVPLLLETQGYEFADRILVVDCAEEQQIERVSQRSGLTREQIMAIMATQVTRRERLEAADDVIHNEGNKSELRARVEQLHHKYLKLAR